MSESPIPNIIWGVCPRCGSRGADYASVSSADAEARDTTGNGTVLESFRGELMCELCIKTILQDEESMEIADKNIEDEIFLAKAGFKHTIDT